MPRSRLAIMGAPAIYDGYSALTIRSLVSDQSIRVS